MDDKALMEKFDVSRAALSKLRLYHALLLKWQKAVNIVSPKTLDKAWERHFVDSLQVLPFIPDQVKIIADLGSGGGFPGLVIACVRDDVNVHSVESDMKKCQFQSNVSREAISFINCSQVLQSPFVEGVPVNLCQDVVAPLVQEKQSSLCNFTMHNKRIEQVYDDISPDLVMARALASLEKLFDYVYPWVERNSAIEFLFLKGSRAEEEIAQASKFYDFSCKAYPSITDDEASILYIRNLTRI